MTFWTLPEHLRPLDARVLSQDTSAPMPPNSFVPRWRSLTLRLLLLALALVITLKFSAIPGVIVLGALGLLEIFHHSRSSGKSKPGAQ